MGGSNLTAKELYQQKQSQLPATNVGVGANGETLSAPTYPKLEVKKEFAEIPAVMPESKGEYDNSPTADYPSVRGATQNNQGRDTSVSEFMKAKTYKKKQKPLNALNADWPDERE